MAHAIRILRYGEPEALALTDVPTLAPGPHEITIQVHVIGVNYPDLLVVRGLYQNLAPLPFSPGKEVAGVVTAVGADVTKFRVNQRVLCFVENGGYVDEIGRSNVFVSKSKALGSIYRTFDYEVCSRCSLRVFRECSRFGLESVEEQTAARPPG